MSLKIILSIVLIHWFADFVMQRPRDAANKSKSFEHLFSHVWAYSCLMTVFILLTNFISKTGSINLIDYLLFYIITFICHFATDYYSSRWMKKMYNQKNFGVFIPRGFDFFVTLGFDQVLHYFQLFITYKLLFL